MSFKRFGLNCAYELNFVTVNPAPELVLFALVEAGVKESPSPEPFYQSINQSIRNQLMALPIFR